jgi:hypothetical protein
MKGKVFIIHWHAAEAKTKAKVPDAIYIEPAALREALEPFAVSREG